MAYTVGINPQTTTQYLRQAAYSQVGVLFIKVACYYAPCLYHHRKKI